MRYFSSKNQDGCQHNLVQLPVFLYQSETKENINFYLFRNETL